MMATGYLSLIMSFPNDKTHFQPFVANPFELLQIATVKVIENPSEYFIGQF